MATNMTHLAPSPWRGFCLATHAPSAGSLPMPVGCPAVTSARAAAPDNSDGEFPTFVGLGDFRHFVTAITGGGWVLCEVKALSHGMEGQSNAYHRFGYCRRDRIRRLVGLYGCAVEGWEGGCACGVGSDLTACDYVALASRRNTGRILAT